VGASRSFGELAAKLDKAASKAANGDRVLQQAALHVKKSVQAELRRVAPSGRLSGVGKSGARVGVRYDELKNGRTVLVRMTGPAHLIERDTKAHVIRPKRRRKPKPGKRTAIKIGGSYWRTVQHPGTRGQHPWEKGLKRAGQPVRRDFAKGLSTLLGEVF
jgi:hypothetical protein